MRQIFRSGAVCAIIIGAFLLGRVHWHKDHIFPLFHHDLVMGSQLTKGPIAIFTDLSGKTKVQCPVQTAKTLVILVIGQSNAANGQGQRNVSSYGDKVINYFDGKCFIASSPLLGNDGTAGESWTMLGNKLIASGIADRVILAPSAVGGSNIRRWIAGGDIYPIVLNAISSIKKNYKITDVIWHQGESDYFFKTTKIEYQNMFESLVNYLRVNGISAPIFVSVASKCNEPKWVPNNSVTEAQRALPDPRAGIYPGVDTDALLGPYDRFEGCHIDYTGQQKFTDAMLKILQVHATGKTVATN
jgi:hypothetical protein